MTSRLRPLGPGLIAGLAILPAAMAVSMAFFYLGKWPTEDPFDEVFYGTLAGVAFWIFASLAFLRGLADVKNGDAATYDELRVRAATLRARLDGLARLSGETPRSPAAPSALHDLDIDTDASEIAAGDDTASRELRGRALIEANELLEGVDDILAGRTEGSTLRWSGASGYISVWRQLHRAEEAVLVAEPREVLFAEAVDDEGRLLKTKVDGTETLLAELRRLLGEPSKRRPLAESLRELDPPQGRALLRKIRYCLNAYRDDLFQRFVRIRNAMFATLVYVGLVGDAVLALAIVALPREYESAVVAGMTYYLVGALVGLFAELYGAQKGHRGAVHDYGLALVRLLTIPVLSGIAAVLGVVLTRLGGAASTSEVSFEEIFSLTSYPLGVIVAAIFGLTPGLLLERLRVQTNEYKEELVRSTAGTPSASSASATT